MRVDVLAKRCNVLLHILLELHRSCFELRFDAIPRVLVLAELVDAREALVYELRCRHPKLSMDAEAGRCWPKVVVLALDEEGAQISVVAIEVEAETEESSSFLKIHILQHPASGP